MRSNLSKMNRSKKIQYLIEEMLDNPFYTPVNLWLQLINKMESHELDMLIKLHHMDDIDLSEQQATDLLSIIKRHMPGVCISELFPEDHHKEEEDEYLHIGLN